LRQPSLLIIYSLPTQFFTGKGLAIASYVRKNQRELRFSYSYKHQQVWGGAMGDRWVIGRD
jgi:hypothetical protein